MALLRFFFFLYCKIPIVTAVIAIRHARTTPTMTRTWFLIGGRDVVVVSALHE
jgi:hypothetical protein